MANRRFVQFQKTLVREAVSLYAYVTFGSTGAPTLVKSKSQGVVSVTRNSAGVYTFVFGSNTSSLDTYQFLLHIKHLFDATANSGTAPAAPGMYLTGNSIATNGTASVQVTFNSAGTATDPASTEAVYMQFVFKNTSGL
jgi:hypothetical protein